MEHFWSYVHQILACGFSFLLCLYVVWVLEWYWPRLCFQCLGCISHVLMFTIASSSPELFGEGYGSSNLQKERRRLISLNLPCKFIQINESASPPASHEDSCLWFQQLEGELGGSIQLEIKKPKLQTGSPAIILIAWHSALVIWGRRESSPSVDSHFSLFLLSITNCVSQPHLENLAAVSWCVHSNRAFIVH